MFKVHFKRKFFDMKKKLKILLFILKKYIKSQKIIRKLILSEETLIY